MGRGKCEKYEKLRDKKMHSIGPIPVYKKFPLDSKEGTRNHRKK